MSNVTIRANVVLVSLADDERPLERSTFDKSPFAQLPGHQVERMVRGDLEEKFEEFKNLLSVQEEERAANGKCWVCDEPEVCECVASQSGPPPTVAVAAQTVHFDAGNEQCWECRRTSPCGCVSDDPVT